MKLMKKYLRIVLIIAVSTFIVCFFLYKATHSGRINHESNTPEILFTRDVSDNAFEVCTIGINGKNLNKLLTVNKGNLTHIALNTDQSTVDYIKNNLGRFKDAFTHQLCVFSKNFYAYSIPIEENDVVSVSGEGCSKGVFICNVETAKTLQIDRYLIHQLPSSQFSKDGDLFVNSLSFSHDGKFLFVCSHWFDLAVFSVEQMKFIGVFHIDVWDMRNVDKVQNNLYFIGGTDSSNIFEFDMEKGELKPLTNCIESTFSVSPDNKNLVFTESYLNGKNDLGILNLENDTLKRIDYPKGCEIDGFVLDSKHLILKRYHKLSDMDINWYMSIYLLNLNTLKETEIYVESPGNT